MSPSVSRVVAQQHEVDAARVRREAEELLSRSPRRAERAGAQRGDCGGGPVGVEHLERGLEILAELGEQRVAVERFRLLRAALDQLAGPLDQPLRGGPLGRRERFPDAADLRGGRAQPDREPRAAEERLLEQQLVERVFELLAHRLALLLGKVQDPVGAAALRADLQVGAALLKRVAQRLFQPFGQQLHAVLAEGVRRAVELGHEHLEAPGREVEVVVRVDPRDVRVGRDRAPL